MAKVTEVILWVEGFNEAGSQGRVKCALGDQEERPSDGLSRTPSEHIGEVGGYPVATIHAYGEVFVNDTELDSPATVGLGAEQAQKMFDTLGINPLDYFALKLDDCKVEFVDC